MQGLELVEKGCNKARINKGNEEAKFKFIDNKKINNKVSFKIFQLISIILENGMSILGVSLPRKM